MPPSLFIVGLTGGIGSGKSSAASCFAQLGAFVIDADAMSHALTQPGGAAIPLIDAGFAGVVVNGVLDRAALRERVFGNAAKRAQLEAILHPMIRAATRAELESDAARNAPYVIHMVPLLFESKDYAQRIHCAVVVDVDEETQVRRVTANRDVPVNTVRQIIASQMSRVDRLARAQFIIDNTGSAEQLAGQVARLHRVFVANATLHTNQFERHREGAAA